MIIFVKYNIIILIITIINIIFIISPDSHPEGRLSADLLVAHDPSALAVPLLPLLVLRASVSLWQDFPYQAQWHMAERLSCFLCYSSCLRQWFWDFVLSTTLSCRAAWCCSAGGCALDYLLALTSLERIESWLGRLCYC